MNHDIEANLSAHAGCGGLAGKMMSIGATIVSQHGGRPLAPPPVPAPVTETSPGTINLGNVTLRPWGR
jgi:hypothetical protein